MIDFKIPEKKKIRVILDTDAKNEVDDQFAIVQALLTQSFDLRGIISAHFGEEKSSDSEFESYDEIMHILKLMGMENNTKVLRGGKHKITDGKPVVSEGAEFIAEEAMKDEGELYLVCLGAITDAASALMIRPEIAQRLTIIWIGGRDYPCGGWEYNLKNDIFAGAYVFSSQVKLWQIPRNVYRMMPVSFAELYERVYSCGEIGKYLCSNVINFNNADDKRPTEYRILGDSPAVGVLLYEDCGEWEEIEAPQITEDMGYCFNSTGRNIRVYKNINSRFILEDLYAKLKIFAQS